VINTNNTGDIEGTTLTQGTSTQSNNNYPQFDGHFNSDSGVDFWNGFQNT
jgi:hypothetical protein